MGSLGELTKAGIATAWAVLLSFVPVRRGTQEETQTKCKGDELTARGAVQRVQGRRLVCSVQCINQGCEAPVSVEAGVKL
jgi:hypothetical protein